MAINPVQLVALQRQTPDFVGNWLAGRQFAANQDRQNRILDMQEQQFSLRHGEAERARQEALRLAEANYWGNASQLLQSAPEEQRGAIWNIIRNQAIANGLPDVQEEMPEQYIPGIETEMFAQARLMGYDPGGGADAPAGLREFEGIAAAAGLEPGTDDYQQAARVRLGLDGRASSAGAQTFRMRGSDGVERVFRFDPQTQGLAVYDGSQWVEASESDRRRAAGISGEAAQPRGEFLGRPLEEQAALTAEATPEKGMRFNEQGEMVPIPGGSVARELDAIARREQQRAEQVQRAGGTVVQDLGRALEVLEAFPTLAAGPATLLQPKNGFTPAGRMQQFVESALSNIGVDQLQQMRESSPTGGALGNVAVQQQMRLEQLLGSLRLDQPRDVLEDNIKRIQNIYLDIIHGTGKGPARQRLSFDELGRKVEGGVPWGGDPVIMEAEQQTSPAPTSANSFTSPSGITFTVE